jgi:c-di-GMP-binding flagellar brake protein YcgR
MTAGAPLATAPTPNTPVGLHLPCCADDAHPSRVESVTATSFVVATPHDHDAPPAEPFVVSWAEGTVGIELPTLVTESRAAPYPVWVVAPVGAPKRVQRREYVRIPESADSAGLRLFTTGGAVAATVLDLSEGGVRCTVPAAVGAGIGDRFELVLSFDQAEVSTAGAVVRAHGVGNLIELGVRFADMRTADADRVRAHVFARQAHLRSAR